MLFDDDIGPPNDKLITPRRPVRNILFFTACIPDNTLENEHDEPIQT